MSIIEKNNLGEKKAPLDRKECWLEITEQYNHANGTHFTKDQVVKRHEYQISKLRKSFGIPGKLINKIISDRAAGSSGPDPIRLPEQARPEGVLGDPDTSRAFFGGPEADPTIVPNPRSTPSQDPTQP